MLFITCLVIHFHRLGRGTLTRTMAEGLQAQVKKDTRGVLLSRMGGVPLDKFNRDYQELLGNRFPYRDLGFNDLRSCLESMDDTVR